MNSHGKNWTVLLLSLMIFMAPAMGAPTEELLQDTLKSILVSFFALAAGLVFFWQARKQNITVHFHSLLWLPLGLMTYALGSMAWSHAYLGGVEAIRWFVLSLVLFLGMNTFSLDRVTRLAWGVHLGAVVASLWAALQFWDDFRFFAQGPAPASTFVNRNFFGEFLVCTLPFSVLLLSRVKDKASVFLLTFSLGFNIAALMMTGTRSALMGLLLLMVLLPVVVFLYRKQFESTGWRIGHCLALLALLICSVLGIGSINTVNPALIAESGHGDAIDRAVMRTLSMTKADEYSRGSFSIRAVMWKATGRMIRANPATGVGAGAWEVQVPLYQEAGSQLETDYYAHNEILQLVAEYGITGWLFLLCLASYLLWAAHKTWTDRSPQGEREALLRALTLASLLVFLLVSNAGFPWRMASTGALFALSLAILAASDIRLDTGKTFLLQSIRWKARYSCWALFVTALCAALAVYIAQQSIICESKLVRAVKIALTISQSGKRDDPGWGNAKAEMLQLVRDGVAINPHYRKLTPMVADAIAGWGDWANATWVWESVLESRPYVVAMLTNVARGHMQTGDLSKAQDYLNRARNLQPTAPALASLEVMLWSRTGKDQEAVLRAKELLRTGVFDFDLVKTSYFLGMRNRDPELAIQALELRIKTWPNQSVDGWLKLGHIYAASESRNEERAIQSYRSALAAADPQHQAAVLAMIPANYQAIAKAKPRTP
jgi:O-antigen ligase